MFRFLLFSVFAVSLAALPLHISKKTLANGETTLLLLPKEKGVAYEKVCHKKECFEIFLTPSKQEYYALIPFSYYDKAGNKELLLYYKEKKEEKREPFFIKLKYGNYKKESIHVSSKKVNPKSPKVKKRTAREYREAIALYNRVTPKLYIDKPFILPLESVITSEFGKARVYNGSLKGYHSGTDFRASVGTAVRAANDGVIAYVGKRFYSGGTVIIDHGEGIYSCYFHLSKFLAQKGQKIQRGEILGLSGKSGRVTGPHLHFAIRVHGVQVNPLQFIELTNKELLKERN
ncbi:MAG: M23 family metallopeptidase [Sulfurimonas sp.]